MTCRPIVSRRVVLAITGGWAQGLLAQSGARRRRLALLSAETAAATASNQLAFVEAMRPLGWVDGRDFVLETHFADGNYPRLRVLAKAMADDPPDLVLTPHNSATAAAKQNMPASTPIVMISSLDPVAAGFAETLARPGGNITGLTWAPPETIGKQVEIAVQLVPGARRLVVLTQSSRESMAQADHARPAASRYQMDVVAVVADTLEAVARRLPAGPQRAHVAVIPAMAAYRTFRAELHQLLLERQLPAVYAVREHVLAGGAASYGPNLAGNYRQAARLVDRVLRGAKPASVPIEQPTTYDLVLNRSSIRAQMLALPNSLLLRATEVID